MSEFLKPKVFDEQRAQQIETQVFGGDKRCQYAGLQAAVENLESEEKAGNTSASTLELAASALIDRIDLANGELYRSGILEKELYSPGFREDADMVKQMQERNEKLGDRIGQILDALAKRT